jgi:hypothetical protein
MNYRMNVSLALCPLCQFQCRYGSSLPARTVQYSAVQRSSVHYITLQYSADSTRPPGTSPVKPITALRSMFCIAAARC